MIFTDGLPPHLRARQVIHRSQVIHQWKIIRVKQYGCVTFKRGLFLLLRLFSNLLLDPITHALQAAEKLPGVLLLLLPLIVHPLYTMLTQVVVTQETGKPVTDVVW